MSAGSRWIAACLATSLIAGPALADSKKPSDKDKQVASDLVKKAIARSQAGDHSAAIDIYLQAYTIVPNSILLSNIGAEYQQSGKQKEALRYFCLYLEKDPQGTNATYATARAKALRHLIDGKKVDDDEVCEADKPKEPEEDPEAKPERGERSERRRKPREDEPEIKPLDEPRATASGGSSSLRTAGLMFGGVGLVSLGVGIYAGMKAQDISDEISKHNTEMYWNDPHGLEDRGQTYEYLQIGSLVAGGAFVVTGLVLYLNGRDSEAPSHDKAAVHVAPTHNGFAVFGSF